MQDGGKGGAVYTEDFVAKLELLWGDGFLSPGGPEEVAELFHGIDLAGTRVLNIGSGLGTMERILIRDHGAAQVLGIDIEPQLIERAEQTARREGLAERVSFQLVAPGPLPFPDNGFDVVTSKDAIICVEDKHAIYAQAFRVLKPGGHLVVGDWFSGAPPFSAEMHAWKDTAPGHYFMATLDDMAAVAESIGFVEIETRDRNDWYRDMSRQELDQITGPKRVQVTALLGETEARAWIERVGKKTAAVIKGDLRPGHLRARKPG